ncbi:hypothetical protein CTAM01_13888 [Colletotrichum tamarilloi]|nr:uncharacterized protein CTAM01_13888 [Colletotrichum tamarilloi]KAK1481728.1 hypothetical protein CTAM01_13888 [Colletotrichum tamarilloi]
MYFALLPAMGPSRNFDEDADDNFHAAPRLEEPENGAKDDDG